MADQMSVEEVLDRCERYWQETGVRGSATGEMRRELESHLREAEAAGKRPSDVVGPDVAAFAEDWAAVERGPRRRASWSEVRQSGRKSRGLAVWGILIVAVVVVLAVTGPKENNVDSEVWRWMWIGAAIVLGIGELLTAGLFMLPFAVGALAAFVLALFDVNVWIQIVTFLGVSVASLWGLRSFAWRESEPNYPVGARRYVDALGVVTEPVERISGRGEVRIETALWRATTELEGVIEVGEEVRVVDVRGARLVVEPRT